MKTVSTHEDDGVPGIAAGLNAESQVVLQPPSRATQRLLEAVQDRSCVEGVQAGHLAPWPEPNQPEPAPESSPARTPLGRPVCGVATSRLASCSQCLHRG